VRFRAPLQQLRHKELRKNNMHRMRMPHKQIDTIISWAKPINALVFYIQVGHSSVKAEVAELEKYLAMPNVHLELTLNFR
jgi:hypothetical protein